MLQPDLSLQLRLLADAARLPQAAAADRVGSVARLEPGQPVTARIQEQLADGRYKVLLAGRTLSLQLPVGAQPGQDIRLMYVGPEPRLKFALLPQQESSASVSATGRMISAIMSARQQSPAAAAPLLDAMPADSREIAPQLRQALTLSGLFYESHQAQWVEGERPLDQLLQEPQGRLSPTAMNGKGAAVAGGGTALPQTPTAMQAAADVTTQTAPIHPESLPIVQQQLGTLETGQILWQGQIWPGQFMEWKVTGFADQHHADRGADESEATWETSLSLELPALGPINARLRLQPGGIAITLQADDTEASGLLRNRGAELVNAMSAAGLSVSDVRVLSHAPA